MTYAAIAIGAAVLLLFIIIIAVCWNSNCDKDCKGQKCSKKGDKIAVILSPTMSMYDRRLAEEFIGLHSNYTLFFQEEHKLHNKHTGKSHSYSNVYDLYDDLYCQGYRYFIGYVFTSDLEAVYPWLESRDHHDVTLISLGSALPRFRDRRIVRLYGDYQPYTNALSAYVPEGALVLYEPSSITSSVLSYLSGYGKVIEVGENDNLPSIIESEEASNVLLLVSNTELLKRSDYPSANYIMPDLLTETNIAPFPHQITSLTTYHCYSTLNGRALALRNSFSTGGIKAIKIANWLRTRHTSAFKANSAFRNEFNLNDDNDAYNDEFIGWTWIPGGLWVYTSDVGGMLESELASTGDNSAYILGLMFRNHYWLEDELNKQPTRTSLRALNTLWDSSSAIDTLLSVNESALSPSIEPRSRDLESLRVP